MGRAFAHEHANTSATSSEATNASLLSQLEVLLARTHPPSTVSRYFLNVLT